MPLVNAGLFAQRREASGSAFTAAGLDRLSCTLYKRNALSAFALFFLCGSLHHGHFMNPPIFILVFLFRHHKLIFSSHSIEILIHPIRQLPIFFKSQAEIEHIQ